MRSSALVWSVSPDLSCLVGDGLERCRVGRCGRVCSEFACDTPHVMENGPHPPQKTPSRAHTVCGDRLVETTPEVNREVAESAMLLPQGAHQAIEMMREADNGNAERAAPRAPAGAEARPV